MISWRELVLRELGESWNLPQYAYEFSNGRKLYVQEGIYKITVGTVSFSSATYSVAENAGSVTITATRVAGTHCPATTVRYATSQGTATAGTDYTETSGTLSWAEGETGNKTFTVPVKWNTSSYSDNTVNLTLSQPTGAVLGDTPTAVLTITNVNSATDYDGSTNNAQLGSQVTLCPDGRLGTFSCFFRRDSSTANSYLLDSATGFICTVLFNGTNHLQFDASNSGGSTLMARVTGSAFTQSSTVHSLVARWNLNTGPVVQVVVDRVLESLTGTLNAGIIDYDRVSGMNWTVGSATTGTNKFSGPLAEYFFHDDDVGDLTVAANLNKFVDANNLPANKGTDGSLVFNTKPRIYAKNGDLSAQTGSSGPWTFNGAKVLVPWP